MNQRTKTKLEVVCGPMFSGKTEELIRRLKRAVIAKQIVLVYKPCIDNRYGDGITSHGNLSLETTTGIMTIEIPCENIQQYMLVGDKVDVVAFDEAQFFDASIIDAVTKLQEQGKRVICAGLDLDCYKKPFGPMPQLLALAHEITKLTAVCSCCQNPASKTTAKVPFDGLGPLVAASDSYDARCDDCWSAPPVG